MLPLCPGMLKPPPPPLPPRGPPAPGLGEKRGDFCASKPAELPRCWAREVRGPGCGLPLVPEAPPPRLLTRTLPWLLLVRLPRGWLPSKAECREEGVLPPPPPPMEEEEEEEDEEEEEEGFKAPGWPPGLFY